MKTERIVLTVLSAAWVLAGAGVAAAQGIVLESHVGERPADADALLGPIHQVLGERAYVTGTVLVERIDGELGRSGRGLAPQRLREAKALIDRGEESYYRGRFAAAVADAGKGLAMLMEAPAHLAREQGERDAYRRALVVVAESHRRQRHSREATAAMAELLRSFPNRPLSTAQYSPDVVKFSRKVKRELDEQGRGRLEVSVDDPSVSIFINEGYAGGGKIAKKLHPGEYRVYLQKSATRTGRVHRVVVNQGATTQLSLSWELDGALKAQGSFAGLVFVDDGQRGQAEARSSMHLARKLGAKTAIVVGFRQYAQRRAIVGTVLSLDTGKPLRSAQLVVEPARPDAARIRELARFLAGDKDAGPFDPIGDGDRRSDRRSSAKRPLRTVKWFTLLGGVGALAGGGALIALHQDSVESMQQVEFTRDSRTAGIITLSAGAVITGLGIYFFVRDSRAKRRVRMTVLPTRDGLNMALLGRF